jgi:hypothetical protein
VPRGQSCRASSNTPARAASARREAIECSLTCTRAWHVQQKSDFLGDMTSPRSGSAALCSGSNGHGRPEQRGNTTDVHHLHPLGISSHPYSQDRYWNSVTWAAHRHLLLRRWPQSTPAPRRHRSQASPPLRRPLDPRSRRRWRPHSLNPAHFASPHCPSIPAQPSRLLHSTRRAQRAPTTLESPLIHPLPQSMLQGRSPSPSARPPTPSEPPLPSSARTKQ